MALAFDNSMTSDVDKDKDKNTTQTFKKAFDKVRFSRIYLCTVRYVIILFSVCACAKRNMNNVKLLIKSRNLFYTLHLFLLKIMLYKFRSQ